MPPVGLDVVDDMIDILQFGGITGRWAKGKLGEAPSQREEIREILKIDSGPGWKFGDFESL